MGHVKRKSAFEHAQNVRIHIILHMCKVSSGHLLPIEPFCRIQWFCSRTAMTQSRLCVCLLSAHDPKAYSRLVGFVCTLNTGTTYLFTIFVVNLNKPILLSALLDEWQTVKSLIRRRVLRRLILVVTVCSDLSAQNLRLCKVTWSIFFRVFDENDLSAMSDIRYFSLKRSNKYSNSH